MKRRRRRSAPAPRQSPGWRQPIRFRAAWTHRPTIRVSFTGWCGVTRFRFTRIRRLGTLNSSVGWRRVTRFQITMFRHTVTRGFSPG